MSLYHWKPGTFSPEVEAMAKDILGKCICSESHKGRGMCDIECSFCCEIESVERTRARVLAEVRAALEEIVYEPNQFGLVEGEDILALFDRGGKFGCSIEGGRHAP